MRAAVYHGRRDVRIDPVAAPGEPARGELLVAVTLAGICGTDAAEWAHGPHVSDGLPLILGHEFVGKVERVGSDVGEFTVGDRIVSGAGVSCLTCAQCRRGRTNLCASYRTLGQQLPGGLAELVRVPAAICRRVPDTCDDASACLAQPLAV